MLSLTAVLLATLAQPPSISELERSVPLTAEYTGPYLVQPGFAVGTWIPVKTWSREAQDQPGAVAKWRALHLGPRLSFFARPYNHLSMLANAELGWRSVRLRRGFYSAFTVAAGYLLQGQITAFSVDLSSGDLDRRREARHHFLPTAGYEVGQEVHPRVGWYFRGAIGRTVSLQREGALWFTLGVGIQVRLGARPRTEEKDAS